MVGETGLLEPLMSLVYINSHPHVVHRDFKREERIKDVSFPSPSPPLRAPKQQFKAPVLCLFVLFVCFVYFFQLNTVQGGSQLNTKKKREGK